MMNKQIARIKNAKSRIVLGLIMSRFGSNLHSLYPSSRIVLGLIMSIAMAAILSFVITLSYAGFVPNLLSIWMQRLVISLTVGPPIALMLLPLVMKLVGKIVRESR